MKLCIWGQGKVGQVGVVFVRRLNGDSLCASGRLERKPLARGRDTCDSFELGLELRDRPRRSDSTLCLRELGDDDERNVCHG
jgi:hypothetical protein